MKVNSLASAAAFALVALPAVASPARRALFDANKAQHRDHNDYQVEDQKRDYRLSVPLVQSETGFVTEEVTVTTTTTVTSLPSLSSTSGFYFSSSSIFTSGFTSGFTSSFNMSTSTDDAVHGTSSMCPLFPPFFLCSL